MVGGCASAFCGVEDEFELFSYDGLANEFGEGAWAQCCFGCSFEVVGSVGYESLAVEVDVVAGVVGVRHVVLRGFLVLRGGLLVLGRV